MVIRIQPVLMLCLAVLLVASHVEGRWHNLRVLRKQPHRAVYDTGDEDRDLEKSLLADGDFNTDSEDNSDRQQYLRYRRHHQLEMKEDEEPQQPEYEELEEIKRLPRHRFLDHRRHNRNSHHHQHRRPRHRQDQLDSDPLDITREQSEDYDSTASRDKRHNRHKPWTDKDRQSFISSRLKPSHFENEKAYEVEVREAQNSSLCNYTVIPIPDPGGRMPRDLEHVKCNHAGSKCQDKGTYCCIQTYRHVEVVYASGTTETLKVYSGCVCSLQIYGTLEPYIPDVNVDD